MDFGNIAVLALTFIAPAAAIIFLALRGEAPGVERKASLLLFGLGMLVAAVGVARMDLPVKMDFLWPITMEQSGYFEFSIQTHWTRYVWILYSSALLFGFALFDAPAAFEGGRKGLRLLFFTGSFFFSVLAFLSENILLSLMFVEMAAFLLHAFGMEVGGPTGEMEKDSYFKRACFLFLGMATLLVIALSGQLATGSVMLLGAVLYVLSTVVSKHNPANWSQFSLTLVHIGLALFLLERVAYGESSPELWAPLAAVFAVSTVLLAAVSLLSSSALAGTFWLALSFLSYLLYLRFSSTRPTDPFWGVYEAVGLGSAYAMGMIFRFGDRMDLLWKRALSFVLVGIFLGILSGALPSVELSAARFDSETSLVRMVSLGLLTFLVSAISAKALVLSLGKNGRAESSPRAYLFSLVPSFLILAAQVGALLRWNELNFDSVAAGGIPAMLYDSRVLIASASVVVGMLSGSLLGVNLRKREWKMIHDRNMEVFFPSIDPSLIRWNLHFVRFPEQSIEKISSVVMGWGVRSAGFIDSVDKASFGDRFFRGLTHYGTSLSLMTRYFHSGQVRMYFFIGVLVTLFASFLFLLEGR